MRSRGYLSRLLALQTATAALAAARTPAEVAAVIRRQGCAAVGATDGALYLLTADGAWLERIQPAGQAPDLPNTFDRLAVFNEGVRREPRPSGMPFVPAPANRGQNGTESADLLTLSVGERTIGAVALRFGATSGDGVPDREALRRLTQVTAEVLERALIFAQAEERARAAEELAHERGQLVADFCHELRTPLNAIVGFTDILRWHSGQYTEDERLEHLQRVLQSASRQQRLLNDLLARSNLAGPELAPRREKMDMAVLARQAADEVAAAYRGQRIVPRGPGDLRVLVDAERAPQVLTNLLDNAAKYSPEGSEIDISWRAEDGMAVVRVRDQGPGVPIDGRDRLFTRFGRIPGCPTRPGRTSTGLGLYLSRSLARAMGGDLDLEVTGPRGSTFRLRLPLALG